MKINSATASWVRLAASVAGFSARAKVAVMVGADIVALPLTMLLAVDVGRAPLGGPLAQASAALALTALAALPLLAWAGLYRAMVRYIDVVVIASAGAALAVLCLAAYGLTRLMPVAGVSDDVLLVFWFMAFAYVVTSRIVARSFLRRGMRGGAPAARAIIYGAGEAGVQLAHAMRFSREYLAVCFLDDDPARQGKTVAGLRVYPAEAFEAAALRYRANLVVVAAPSATTEQRQAMIARVRSGQLPVKTLPALHQMVEGQADTTQIREVDLEDLLGRTPVAPDPLLMTRNIRDKTVLVTGAGGSIGSELCRQILAQQPRKLVLLDHSEFALYSIHQELAAAGPKAAVPLVAVLGSVQDGALLQAVLNGHGVDTVYHAAAYKHVPLVEANVQQGLLNNVLGTRALARAVGASRVSTCILVSTDKAVRPTNVMGASKRVAELIFQAAALRHAHCVFAMVRFGNVLGSSGSVVPLFRRQLAHGGPITLTHPEITRYFMLIPEATQLVIQAGAMARGGEVFVLDMGQPVKIIDLARTLIRLSGLSEKTADNPEGEIEITSVGLRPGEKLYEELLIGDDVVPSGHPRIMCAREWHVDPALLDKMLAALQRACEENEADQMLRLVRNLVPEFRPADEVNAEVLSQKAGASSPAFA